MGTNMSVKDISKFIYWRVMPIGIGAVMFFYIDKMEVSMGYKILIFLVISLPIVMIRLWIGMKIFKEKMTLTEKIMSCSLRRKHGNSYCVECPESYTCANGDIENRAKT